MILRSTDGAEFGLRPVRYEFGGRSIDPFDDFLVVDGHVRLADGRSWTFSDPALLAAEATQIAPWLRDAHSCPFTPPKRIDDTDWDETAMLTFIEPVVAFSVAGRLGYASVIRVHFSLEGLPPWERQDELHNFFVPFELQAADLVKAAAQWERDIVPFPVRAHR